MRDADAFDARGVWAALADAAARRRACREATLPPARGGDRAGTAEPVEPLTPRAVTSDPAGLADAAWVDGTQAQHTLAYTAYRPVTLVHAVAAGLAPHPTTRRLELAAVAEHLAVVCADPDADWVAACLDDPDRWLVTVADADPDAIAAAASAHLDTVRRDTEHQACAELLAHTPGPVVVDGSVTTHPRDPRVHGVAKTHRARWLDDETVLYRLRGEQRTGAFRLTDPDGATRYSAYLRLHPPAPPGRPAPPATQTAHAWDHGLVRLETHHPDQLDALAALALATRQHPHSPDPRGDRHLAPIAECERAARSRYNHTILTIDRA